MADATYQPKVYRDLGGNRINIVSGGALNIEAGSTNAIAGDVTHSGVNTFSGALRRTDVNATINVTASAIAEGFTLMAATSGSAALFEIAAPVAGARVHVVHTESGSTSFTISTTDSGATIGAAGNTVTFLKNTYGSVVLRGRTTGVWDVVELHGANVALS